MVDMAMSVNVGAISDVKYSETFEYMCAQAYDRQKAVIDEACKKLIFNCSYVSVYGDAAQEHALAAILDLEDMAHAYKDLCASWYSEEGHSGKRYQNIFSARVQRNLVLVWLDEQYDQITKQNALLFKRPIMVAKEEEWERMYLSTIREKMENICTYQSKLWHKCKMCYVQHKNNIDEVVEELKPLIEQMNVHQKMRVKFEKMLEIFHVWLMDWKYDEEKQRHTVSVESFDQVMEINNWLLLKRVFLEGIRQKLRERVFEIWQKNICIVINDIYRAIQGLETYLTKVDELLKFGSK